MYRRLRQISSLLPYICSGNHLKRSREAINLSVCYVIPYNKISDTRVLNRRFHSYRYSTISQVSNESPPSQVTHILSFIESALHELQGLDHCWVNVVEGNKDFFKKDGTFLVLAGELLGNSQIVSMLEKVKLLQQRFPQLCVMGFHCGSSISSLADQTYVTELIMKEYVTFPILLSTKNFFEMENGACYILFNDFRNPIIHHEEGLDLGMLNKAVEELHEQQNGNFTEGDSSLHSLRGSWVKQADIMKEPYSCSSLQNFLLYYPGCVCADESSNRIFLSDSNHHRVIVFDGSGKILDCIGSCPGFEDGEFESAKLLRPAASFYLEAEDCLYIVDSENHAIRRADLEKRVLETIYPTSSINKKNNSLWMWIVNKLGFGRKFDAKSGEVDSQPLVFPWHMLKSADDNLLIISRSFETLWIMDLASGEIKEIIKGFPKILETCGELIMDKVSLLKQMPNDWLQQQTDTNCSLKGLPHASLISSLTTFQNHMVICDTVAQRVLMFSRESGAFSNFQFTNFGILGFPYWLPFSLERVYFVAGSHGTWTDHIQCFSLLPGRIGIQLNVDIPVDTELVEPLQEGCIWCQARGAATEVLGQEGVVGSSEKVGVAQQWYDELDNLAFSTPESEMNVEDDNTASDVRSQDERVHIDCAVNTSPGTSEVIIYAALYLKLRRHPDLQEDSQENYAAKIADILNPGRIVGIGRDSWTQILLKSKSDLRDLIFMRPIHVRIKLDTLDHPKGDSSKSVILTNSDIEVNISLET